VEGPASWDIESIAKGENGDLWCATYSGVSRYNGSEWTNYTMADGLPWNRTCDIDVDNRGNVWIGSDGGVTVYDGDVWKTYASADGLKDNWVKTVCALAPNDVWIGFEKGGIAHFDGGAWKNCDSSDSLPVNYVMDIAKNDAGQVWFAANISVCMYHDGDWKVFTPRNGLPDTWGNCIAADSRGRAWCQLENKLCFYNGAQWSCYTTKDNQYIENVTVMTVDTDDSVWIGLADGRIFHIDVDSGLCETHHFADYTGISDMGLRYMDPSENIFMAGNYSTIAIYKGIKTAVSEQSTPPSLFSLDSYPNPFNPAVTIEFTLPYPGMANLVIYDITGRTIRELLSGRVSAGVHSVLWDGCNSSGRPVSSGVYFARLTLGKKAVVRKMLLMK
jgi:ligand-binding sensor domain-containing protein